MKVEITDEVYDKYKKLDATGPAVVNQIYHLLLEQDQSFNRTIPREDLEAEYQFLTDSCKVVDEEFDSIVEYFHDLMRQCGANEAQITWEIYNNIRLKKNEKKNIKKTLDVIIKSARVNLFFFGLRKYIETLLGIEFTDFFNYEKRPEKYNTSKFINMYNNI